MTTEPRRSRMSSLVVALATAFAGGAAGCLIDDRTGADPGAPAAPTATVPDAGSPLRRESAAETLRRDAEFEQAPADATLEVEPDGRRAPPPPPVR